MRCVGCWDLRSPTDGGEEELWVSDEDSDRGHRLGTAGTRAVSGSAGGQRGRQDIKAECPLQASKSALERLCSFQVYAAFYSNLDSGKKKTQSA